MDSREEKLTELMWGHALYNSNMCCLTLLENVNSHDSIFFIRFNDHYFDKAESWILMRPKNILSHTFFSKLILLLKNIPSFHTKSSLLQWL